jgi:hypothetical protein
MHASLVAFFVALSLAFSHGQIRTPESSPLTVEIIRDGSAQGKTQGGKLDLMNNWNVPLVPVSEQETRFYRTFRFGWVGGTSRIEYAGEGAVMIGLEFNFTKSTKTKESSINSIRPIYQIGAQKLSGAMIGSAKGTLEKCMAKPGYAITDVCFSQMLNSFSGVTVTFSRINPDGSVNEDDSYHAPTIGDGGGSITATRGVPFCGFYASPAEDLTQISGFAFLVSQKVVREKKREYIPAKRGAIPSLTPQPQPVAPAPAPRPPQPAREVVFQVSPELNARINEVLRSSSERLVLVKGGTGVGSGFVCKLGGKPMVLTNQHVIAGNPKFELNSLATGRLAVGEARVALGHDLMAFALPQEVPAYELPADFVKEVGIGDLIMVIGDADGAGVVRPSLGRVLGIGPNLVEISAEILPGNSGSPIIHLKSGCVIGIASYVSAKSFDVGEGRVATQVRRFGFRIDSAQKWLPVDWTIYQAEAAALNSSAAFTETMLKVFETIGNGTFKKTAFNDPRLASALSAIPNTLFKQPTPAERTNITANFMRSLRTGNKTYGDDLKRRLRYDFFQTSAADEEKLRDLLVTEIEKLKDRLPLNVEARGGRR